MHAFQTLTVFLFLAFLTLTACPEAGEEGGFTSQVRVAVFGYGKGDAVRSASAIIYDTASTQICRPYPVDLEKIEAILESQKKKKLNRSSRSSDEDSDALDLLNINPTETGGTDTEGGGVTLNPQRKEAIKTEVGKYWTKLGLRIVNGNTKHNLIITDITFTGIARYRNQNLPFSDSITAGNYCETPGFLYFVPPHEQIEYTPYSTNSLANLTLYISGFPIIDATTQQTTTSPSAGEIAGVSNSNAPPPLIFSRCPIIVPRYSVRMRLRGYFITANGSKDGIWPFHTDIQFDTIYSRPECS